MANFTNMEQTSTAFICGLVLPFNFLGYKLQFSSSNVAFCPLRTYGLSDTRGPAWPPRLSHSSVALKNYNDCHLLYAAHYRFITALVQVFWQSFITVLIHWSAKNLPVFSGSFMTVLVQVSGKIHHVKILSDLITDVKLLTAHQLQASRFLRSVQPSGVLNWCEKIGIHSPFSDYFLLPSFPIYLFSSSSFHVCFTLPRLLDKTGFLQSLKVFESLGEMSVKNEQFNWGPWKSVKNEWFNWGPWKSEKWIVQLRPM